MTDTLYQTLSANAWKKYQSVSKRSSGDLKLIESAYESFASAAKKLDGAVVFSSPPTKEQLGAASNAVTVLESTYNGVTAVVRKFVQSDADAVKASATISQGQKKADNSREQNNDSDFTLSLNNVLYQAQLQVATAISSAGG